MLLRIAIWFLIINNLISCSKEGINKPYCFLNLRVEGQEEDIRWENMNFKWVDSLGLAELEASSYYFDRCTVHLENITNAGGVSPLTLMQFYYTDGLDLRPYAISGTFTIIEASDKGIRGSFDVSFENNFNGVSGKRVSGDFGIINKPY